MKSLMSRCDPVPRVEEVKAVTAPFRRNLGGSGAGVLRLTAPQEQRSLSTVNEDDLDASWGEKVRCYA